MEFCFVDEENECDDWDSLSESDFGKSPGTRQLQFNKILDIAINDNKKRRVELVYERFGYLNNKKRRNRKKKALKRRNINKNKNQCNKLVPVPKCIYSEIV